MSAHIDLQAWWSRTGAAIATQPISEQQLSELERRYDLRLPADFRDYLRNASPAGEAWDKEQTSWWEFGRIRNIPEELQGARSTPQDGLEKYLVFADYLVWSWAWAISCAEGDSRGKIVLVAGTGQDRVVADSFSGFVSRYVEDMRSVC